MSHEHDPIECGCELSMEDVPIADRIDAWHNSDSDLPLHDYLGMTWEEYQQWVNPGEDKFGGGNLIHPSEYPDDWTDETS